MQAEGETLGLATDYAANYVRNSLAVSNARIRKAARTELPIDRMAIVIVGDPKATAPPLRTQPEPSPGWMVTLT